MIRAAELTGRDLIEQFCETVEAGEALEPETVERLAQTLRAILVEADRVDINDKKRAEKVGRSAAAHLGLIGKRGRRKRDEDYGLEVVGRYRRVGGVREAAAQLQISPRTVERYNQLYGARFDKLRNMGRGFAILYSAWEDVLRITRDAQAGKRPVGAYRDAVYKCPDSGREASFIVRPLTAAKERELASKTWDLDIRQGGGLLFVREVLNWWFSNAAYDSPEEDLPVGNDVLLSKFVPAIAVVFVDALRRLYDDLK